MEQSPRTPSNSPFTPGYGKQPHVFAGHEPEVDELVQVFKTYDFGDNHSILVSGLRGSGKTSMLGLLQDAAAEEGWLVIQDDASRGLMERVMGTTIPTIINDLEPTHRQALSALKIWHFSADWTLLPRERPTKPLLRQDLLALSNATDHRGILITVDEVSASKARMRELARFALEINHALQCGANIMIVFAGIKVDLDALQNQEHVTFLRRSKVLDFQRLDPGSTRRVLAETTQIGGRTLAEDALEHMIAASQGYPYLVQLVGDYAWRQQPDQEAISVEDARQGSSKAIEAAQRRVISKVFEDLSAKDREFVTAMAEDPGRSKIADIVQRMRAADQRVSDQYVQVYKKRLIDSGYVRSAGHGYVTFSLPYLGDYIRAQRNSQELGGSAATADPWDAYPPPSQG
ncbi:ATP-binding protein [Kocuria sp.]|uniref:ATP-binding protein n=1 Tax=Kocuria sp. TaxID=1871328 RepID=UPI0026DFA802|nr:ATP-binding protein [Kocuria sp.]MDO5619212.1 ATP-binding protein [Kocuria sp.]